MSAQSKYVVERAGDWGVPVATGYQTATYTAPDGVSLFYRRWLASDTAPTLVLIHGLGAHSGWFIDMGNELHARGHTVFAIDHRGFGRSEGLRGHVRSAASYTRDLTAFLTSLRTERPGSPLFILGHSMGGIFSLHIAAEDATRATPLLAGVILMNPWISDNSKVSVGTLANIVTRGALGSKKAFRAAGGTETMTTNPEAIAMLEADPYWVRAQTASFLYQITRMRLASVARARRVREPALVIQCEADKAIIPAASRRAFDALGSTDKTWTTYPDFAHDCEFEAARAALDDGIVQWITAHSA